MKKTLDISANTVRVDKNHIWLNCMVDPETKEIVEKMFPKDLFRERLQQVLPLNTPVQITVELDDKTDLIQDELLLVAVDFSEKVATQINELFRDETTADLNDFSIFNTRED